MDHKKVRLFLTRCLAFVVLFSCLSFSVAIAQEMTSPAPISGGSVVANPYVQFGALGVLVAILITILKKQDARMEERDKMHAAEREKWMTMINDTQTKESESINKLNATLSEIKGKISN